MNNDFEFDSLIKKMAADHQPELPSPGLIWWRAQILKKQQEKSRIERPLIAMRILAAVVCLAVFVWLWISQSKSMSHVLGQQGVLPLWLGGIAVTLVLLGLVWWTKSEA
jgi:small neutral amino acid transporter SnatA (MarC family)